MSIVVSTSVFAGHSDKRVPLNDDVFENINIATFFADLKLEELKIESNEVDFSEIGCAYSYNVVVRHCDGTRSVWNAGIWDVPCGGNPDGHTEITYLRMYEACD